MTYGSLKALMIAMAAGQGSVVIAQQISPDDTAWESAKASGTAEACQQYLTEFPTGAHAEEAFRCLVEGVIPAGAVTSQNGSVDIY
ncbi:MAG: hypothetical protein AAGA73_04430 [Pseudomonadota bacterium]